MISTESRHPIRAASRAAAGALLAASLLVGCDGAAPGAAGDRAVTDLSGRAVTIDRPATRIVSMMPSVTEWIVAMGAADRLVARTDYDDHPSLDTLPSVGGGLTPSIEWIAARQPDLVIAWPDAPSRSVVSRLEQLGIPVYTAPVESLRQGLRVPADLGVLLDLDHAADSVVAEVERGLDAVRAAVIDRPTPGVLYLIGLDPVMAAGPGTFVDELIGIAGGRNVLHDLDILWPQISVEEVVRRAPDVIIVGSAGTLDPARDLAGRPGWRDVPAVRRGAVHTVDPDLINRPGPRLDEAAARLARIIHGTAP